MKTTQRKVTVNDQGIGLQKAKEIKGGIIAILIGLAVPAASDAGAGKIKFNEFTIKKTTDSSSPSF